MRVLIAAVAILFCRTGNRGTRAGDEGSDFSTQGAIGGKPFIFSLSAALKKDRSYSTSFPAAFTPGCTMEANAFAEQTADFKRAGATIIGVAADKIADLKRFSIKECRSKFAVAVATPSMIRDYDVALPKLAGRSNRTSYVIARDGHASLAHSDMDYREHVTKTLAAVRQLSANAF